MTYSTLWNLVNLDTSDHKEKDIAKLFLIAMLDWKRTDPTNISEFIKDLKVYFGTPLTKDKIDSKKFDGRNAWDIEAGSSISELIDLSTEFYNEADFDKIIGNILNHYEQEFSKVDFIAELKYLTTEQGGRKTPAYSGYRPQVKFGFTEMQTSGQQTFIDKEIVYPGETVNAKIKILSPDFFAGNLTEGMKFEFREGSKIIGIGQITDIINDKLEKPAGNKSIATSGA
ncbi:MAG: hypothetical protein Q8891_07995 [Bacteroidota bacterium]|nr:hypothetical protein [Bacteroidota bacterium]